MISHRTQTCMISHCSHTCVSTYLNGFSLHTHQHDFALHILLHNFALHTYLHSFTLQSHLHTSASLSYLHDFRRVRAHHGRSKHSVAARFDQQLHDGLLRSAEQKEGMKKKANKKKHQDGYSSRKEMGGTLMGAHQGSPDEARETRSPSQGSSNTSAPPHINPCPPITL